MEQCNQLEKCNQCVFFIRCMKRNELEQEHPQTGKYTSKDIDFVKVLQNERKI